MSGFKVVVVEGGVYVHHKGGVYVVLNVGVMEATGEAYVVYRSVSKGEVWLRPLVDFVQPVKWPDGMTKARFCRKQ